jgi:hypothetical protein
MPSKKKPRPSYSVPEDLQETPQSGWVYRSSSPEPESMSTPVSVPATNGSETPAGPSPADPAAAASSEKKEEKNSSGKTSITSEIIDLAAKTVSSSASAVGNAILLGTRLITAPLSVGMRLIGLRK